MEMTVKMIVTIPVPMDPKKKNWAKHLIKLDPGQSTGYAFVGPWLRRGERAELEVGSYVLVYDECGSVRNWYPRIALFRVTTDGLKCVYHYQGGVRETSWALGCRDAIADIVGSQLGDSAQPDRSESPLAKFADQDLVDELGLRGYQISSKGSSDTSS